jgi:hypothetical protein
MSDTDVAVEVESQIGIYIRTEGGQMSDDECRKIDLVKLRCFFLRVGQRDSRKVIKLTQRPAPRRKQAYACSSFDDRAALTPG